MGIDPKKDPVDYILIVLCVVFVWFCALVVKNAKADYDENNEPLAGPTYWVGPAIPVCDKELWDRIREGCDDD